jgi:ribonuclease HI
MKIYTDGSSRGNPGPGGFGVIVTDDEDNYLCHHGEQISSTTNNREELKAILWAYLKYGVHPKYDKGKSVPVIYSDSAYCVNVFNNWMVMWARHGWTRTNRKPLENLDLIKPMYKHWFNGYQIRVEKIKGHSGHKWNELADKLATTGKIN